MPTAPSGPIVRTARLLLRPPSRADTGAFAELLGDPAVMRHLGDGRPLDAAGAERWMDAVTGTSPLGGIGILAVVLVAETTVIGWCGIDIGEDTGRAEVTYALHRRFHGRGLGGEALTALLDLVDGSVHPDLDGIDLEATVDPRNTPSRRLLARSGFAVVAQGPDVHGIATLYLRRRAPGRHTDGTDDLRR